MQNQQQSIDTHLQSHFMSDDALQAEQIEPQSQENYDYYELNIPNLTSQSSEYSEPPILSYSYSGISNASSTPEFTMHSSRVSEQQTQHFIFHKPQKIFTCLQKLVKQVKDVVALEDDLVLYVLFKYQWNKQRLFQDYYSHCSPYVQANKLVKQYNNKQQTTGTCIICDTMQPLLSNPVCHHKYCHQCWKSYMTQKLKSNIPFPGCMQKCPDSPLLLFCFTEHYFPQLFEMYRKIICINYAAINKSITYCPNDKCELFCERVQAGYDIYVQCHCGEIFCFYCRKEPHYPATCEDFCKWSKLVNDQSSSNQWIAKNTKVCPCCKQSVQKYIGCSKIKCVCGAQFCYQCNAKWDENHKSSKGQCVSLARKSSLEQRTSTTAFLQLHQKSLAISRTLKRHIEIITTVLQYIKQEWIMNKFIGLKKEITEAWQALKWGNILSFIYKRNEVEATIQEDFIESIGKVMESVEKMKNIANLISPKDMMAVGDEVIARRQCLRKNRQIWFEAWRSCN